MSALALDAKVLPDDQSRPTNRLLLLHLQEACALDVPGLGQILGLVQLLGRQKAPVQQQVPDGLAFAIQRHLPYVPPEVRPRR